MRTLTHYELDYREQPTTNYDRFHSPYTHLVDYMVHESKLANDMVRELNARYPHLEFRLVACYQGVR